MKYMVTYTTKTIHCVMVEATDEENAIEIAQNLDPNKFSDIEDILYNDNEGLESWNAAKYDGKTCNLLF